MGSRRFLTLGTMIAGIVVACTSTAENQPGQATLTYDSASTEHSEASLDLDTGAMLDGSAADLALVVSGGTTLFNVLEPVNGANALSAGTEEISVEDCRQRAASLSSGSIPEVFAGNHLCILTNQDQWALVTIDKVSNPKQGATSVQVSFVVEVSQ